MSGSFLESSREQRLAKPLYALSGDKQMSWMQPKLGFEMNYYGVLMWQL
ncbi:hypothetical protein ALQ18_02312 [Pseudomonas marginalis pv. marginalis]|nr:hypothetical protein ALQ18_02312 [Pseudomonas marginalis pv. marginalis]